MRSRWTLEHATRPPDGLHLNVSISSAARAGLLSPGPTWAVWAVAKVALQRDCHQVLISEEHRRSIRFSGFVVLRVDWAWMPGVQLETVANPAFTFLQVAAYTPTVIIPDADDASGYNDRLAFMNLEAVPAYCGLFDHMRAGIANGTYPPEAYGGFEKSEMLVHRGLTASGVAVYRVRRPRF